MDPTTPSRADYRFLKRILHSFFGDRVVHRIEEYNVILRAFKLGGGSWENVYQGSVKDIRLLKMIVRTAWKTGRITKSDSWR